MNQSSFLQTLKGSRSTPCPIWFLRQAGRYLPVYQKFAQLIPDFWERCWAPDISSEITTFPLQNFELDAAIFFSDILTIPKVLGQSIVFDNGIHIEPASVPDLLDRFDIDLFHKDLFPVYQGITFTRLKIPEQAPIIGFSGAPWTLLTYMIGANAKDRMTATRAYAEQDFARFTHILDQLSDIVAQHLLNQVSVGADALQIFDSWSGAVPHEHVEAWLLKPWQQIIDKIRRYHPHIPIILFPRSYPSDCADWNHLQGLTAVHLSEDMNLRLCVERVSEHLVLQGGLHPELLKTGGPFLKQAIEDILNIMQNRAYVFNTGHGILPETPVAHVQQAIDWVRGLQKSN